MEFTAPMEENIDKWRNKKQQKYEELQSEVSKNNWLLKAIFIEIGARGWVPKTVFSAFRTLGFLPQAAKKLCGELSACSEEQLCYLDQSGK